jgi:phosphate starvation-inducible protein PhoH and related proteins
MNIKDNMLFGYRSTMTEEQHEMLDLILAPTKEVQVVIVEAEAGTGKTLISTMGSKLRGKNMRYIFAPVCEDEQGYLPGDQVEKSEPYVAPLKQALEKINEDPSNAIFDPRLNKFMNSKAWVFAHPHTYERGVNYEDETVVIDEAQNFTKHQLRKILTRCLDSTKVILIGNIKQCDLEDILQSGFEPYMKHGFSKNWIRKVELTHNFRGRTAKWADSID